jgi:hypothetical protein
VKERLIKKLNETLFKSLLDRPELMEVSKSVLPVKMNVTPEQLLAVKTMFCDVSEIFNLCDDINRDPYESLFQLPRNVSSEFAREITSKCMMSSSYITTILSSMNRDECDEVMQILSLNDKTACLVGGCVRDILIGEAPKDFDFVSSLPYEKLSELFSEAGFTVKETGKQFLVLTATKNGVTFEIANFRKDSITSDGRRPESVEIGDIFEDAARRDFTINSLFYNLRYKQLLDPAGRGLDDIDARLIRFNGNPEQRLKEDFLRGIRFYRFVARGFKPESNSLATVRRMFPEIVAKTDPERIRSELERMIGI